MLARNKLYTRKEPDKDARLFVIFCEGKKTEPNYFKYFNGIASQIKIEIVPHVDGKQSPQGLYENACNCILAADDTTVSKYELTKEDEVWFIIDTDSWGEKIDELRQRIGEQDNWYIAQSNPCFEVWLYYHFVNTKAIFEGIGISKSWKQYLDEHFGGFNSNKHPIYIQSAIENAKVNFTATDGKPDIACTEVFLLAGKILPLVKADIDAALASL